MNDVVMEFPPDKEAARIEGSIASRQVSTGDFDYPVTTPAGETASPTRVTGFIVKGRTRDGKDVFCTWCDAHRCVGWHVHGWTPDDPVCDRHPHCCVRDGQIVMVPAGIADEAMMSLISNDEPPPGADDPGPVLDNFGMADFVWDRFIKPIIAELMGEAPSSAKVEPMIIEARNFILVWQSLPLRDMPARQCHVERAISEGGAAKFISRQPLPAEGLYPPGGGLGNRIRPRDMIRLIALGVTKPITAHLEAIRLAGDEVAHMWDEIERFLVGGIAIIKAWRKVSKGGTQHIYEGPFWHAVDEIRGLADSLPENLARAA
jgi:hypothetical protein